MSSPDKVALARRLAALPETTKARLLPTLASQGVDFSRLPIVPAPAREHWPLSFQQQRLWFVSRLGGAEAALHISGLLRLEGALDRVRLQASLDALVARHPALRTHFGEDEHGVPWQAVADLASVPMAFTDFTGQPAATREAAALALAQQQANRPFDLATAPLIRLHLIALDNTHHWLALTQHHLISDGWSGELLLRELCAHYEAGTGVPEPEQPLKPLVIGYHDYAAWQRDLAATGLFQEQLTYWRQQLGSDKGAAGAQASLALPTDHTRSAAQSFAGERLRLSLSSEVSQGLRALARSRSTSLFNLLLAVLHCTLARLGGNPDVRIGVPSANRAREEVAPVVGFFVNTLVIRAKASPTATFSEVLDALEQAMLGAHAHQDVPFEQLVEALEPERSLAANPLFQVKFTQQMPLLTQTLASGLRVTPLALDDAATRFDLGLDVTDWPDGIEAVFTYATALFERQTIEQVSSTFAAFAEQTVRAPDQPVAALTLPGARPAACGVARPWPHHTLLSLWHQHVTADPTALAVFSNTGGAVNRQELDQASERIAAHLRSLGAGAETRVALCGSSSPAFVMGLLGVLKAGAAYVPLDPATPAARLADIRQDCGAVIALGHGAGVTALQGAGWEVITLSGNVTQPLAGVDATPLAPDPTPVFPDQAAYLIYTSGSTGKPKAVVVSHMALADYTQGIIEQFGWRPSLRMALVSTVAADLGHTVLFGALGSGASLYLPGPDCAFDASRLGDFIQRHCIDVLKMVPSHLAALLQGEAPEAVLPRYALVTGGEALVPALAAEVARLAPACKVFNHYGPTETTVGVLACQVNGQGADIPLGLPLPNARVQILDEQLRPVPAGVAGELYLGGPGVARGYLDRPGLTAERFVPDPHLPGQRLYRSGDRGRWNADGTVQFLGRIDEQVKIRGYRVEPREVSALLRQHPEVAQAEVIAALREDGATQLLAYVVCRTLAADTAGLRAWLAERVPDYMVPAQVVQLANLPLTANGKLDRQQLPAASPVVPQAGDEPPQGDVECLLADIWQQVLRQDHIGRHANFFDLGGDSILSLQIIGRARRAGYKLTPRQVFEQATLAQLAQVAKPLKAAPTPSAAPVHAATPAQARFLRLALSHPAHWNQSVLLTCQQPIAAEQLRTALSTLVARHPSLRLHTTATGLVVRDTVPADLLQVTSVTDTQAFADLCEQTQRSLDLATGQLVKALYAPALANGPQLLLVIHHLAVDGMSWRVLIDELQQQCQHLATNEPVSLAAPGPSAQAWAGRWQQALATGALAEALTAWQAHTKGLQLWPLAGLASTQAPSHKGTGYWHSQLSRRDTEALLALTGTQRRLHIDDLLLTAFAQALAQVEGVAQARLWVDMEGHGRDPLAGDDSDLATSVGWFTSLYPVAVEAGPELRHVLDANRQQRLAVPDQGVSYGLLRELGTAAQQAALGQIASPNLRFNYLGVLDAGFAQQALFGLGDGPRGAERDPQAPPTHTLALDAHVQGGQLHLAWGFDPHQCSAAGVQGLAQAFEQVVGQLISLCTSTAFATLAALDFPLAHLSTAQLAALDIAPVRLEDLYPLSPMQRGMLFEARYAPEQGRYLNQLALTLHHLDVPRFAAAWAATVARHPVLRTAIVAGGPGEAPLQWVDRRAHLAIEQHDLSTVQAVDERLEALTREQRLTPFDLSRPPLMRAALVRLPGDRYRFLWTRHHLLMDGWSSAAVLAEVLERYQTPDAPGLQAAVPRYRAYIGWLLSQPGVMDGDIDPQAKAFWQPRVNAAAEPTLLAAALPAPVTAPATVPVTAPACEAHHGFIDTQWSAEETARLERFARNHRLTLNTLVQGALLVVLQRCTGQPTVMLGTTVAGRPAALADAQQMVGLFINTLPLASTPSPALAPVPWLQALQAENLAMREHEHVPLSALQRLRAGGGPLFDTLLVFENYPLDTAPAGAIADPRALDYSDVAIAETTGYPLTCVATLQPALNLRLAFDTQLFETFGVEHLASQVRQVLGALTDEGTQRLGDISLLDRASQARFEHNSQGPALASPTESVALRVARQAGHTPTATAVRCAGTALDYATLLQRSHGLAEQLRTHGIGAKDRVAIALARGVELPMAMLAVWQVGAAYVPIDPEYPLDRIAYVLEDAGVGAVIADAEGHARLPALPGVAQVTPGTSLAAVQPFEPATLHPEQAAYVIYTSGSTGRPKGVVVTQGALANFIEAMRQSPGLRPHESLLAVTSLSFDIAVLELMLPLVAGAEVVIARHLEARDAAFLSASLDVAQPGASSVMQATPATWRLLLEAGWQPRPGLRMFCGGEALPADLAKALLHPGAELWNLYGPTEATVWTSAALITQVAPINQTIGRPIGNTTLYVLDDALQPSPTHVAGELYIGGAGLASGYHRRPGLSAERFVPDPFAARHTPGARMYRSGDLVRWRSDGTLEYLSRLDQQVKVRGFRIELGEIEAVLCEHPQVRQAAVVAREGAGGVRLLAYACPLAGVTLDIPALRNLLASRLPSYMQPAHIQALNDMPLTPNGKLDRHALPEPALEPATPPAPLTPLEQRMVAVWAPLLGVTQVGPDDDFFALGGHSLLATWLIGAVAQAFEVEVALRAVFEAPTLRGFTAHVHTLTQAVSDLDAMDALLDEFALE